MNTIIREGRIIDPANKRNEIGDVWIVDGQFAENQPLAVNNQLRKALTRVV